MRPVKTSSEKDGPPPGYRTGIKGRRSAVSGRKSGAGAARLKVGGMKVRRLEGEKMRKI